MMARLWWYLDPLSPNQLKNVLKVGPRLKNLSGSVHGYKLNSYLMVIPNAILTCYVALVTVGTANVARVYIK